MSDIKHFELESDRLIMRRPTVEDADDIFTIYASNSITTKYLQFTPHQSVENTIDFINLKEIESDKKKCYDFVLLTKTDGKLIGNVELDLQSGSPNAAKIFCIITVCERSKGYATEALLRIVEFAKTTEIQKLFAYIHPDNIAGIRILEKCGFQEDVGDSKSLALPMRDEKETDCVELSRSLSMSTPPPNLIWEG